MKDGIATHYVVPNENVYFYLERMDPAAIKPVIEAD